MSATGDGGPSADADRWLSPGVRGIGAASLFADIGHEKRSRPTSRDQSS